MDFSLLKKNLKKDFTGFKSVKVAVLSDCSTQYLVQAMRAYGYEKRLDINTWEADYDAIDLSVNNTQSPLYTTKHDYVIVLYSALKLKKKFYSTASKETFADTFIEQLQDTIAQVSKNLKTNFIVYNLPEEPDAVFGNYGNKTVDSFIYQVRKINYR